VVNGVAPGVIRTRCGLTARICEKQRNGEPLGPISRSSEVGGRSLFCARRRLFHIGRQFDVNAGLTSVDHPVRLIALRSYIVTAEFEKERLSRPGKSDDVTSKSGKKVVHHWGRDDTGRYDSSRRLCCTSTRSISTGTSEGARLPISGEPASALQYGLGSPAWMTSELGGPFLGVYDLV